jgi:DNA-binding transcriptional LysR family regulator
LRCEDELFQPLWTEPFVLALPLNHALTQVTLDTPEDLVSACWIMCPTHSSHQRLLPLYGAAAISPAAYAGSFQLALDLTAVGLGLSVVPQSLARARADIVERVLPGLELVRKIGLCFAAQSLQKPAVAALYEALRAKAL